MDDREGKKCPKCGQSVSDTSMICMYCGHNINGSKTADNSIMELKEKNPQYEQNRNATDTSLRSLGVLLMFIGGAFDVISMFLVGTSSLDTFKFFTIGGIICFGIGLFLRFFGS